MDFLKKYNISLQITEEELDKRIEEIGAAITEQFKGEKVVLICILRGSLFFTAELAKRIHLPMDIEFMQVSSYGSGTTSTGHLRIKKDLETAIAGENVIIVEDIIDTGNTLARLYQMLQERNPKTLTLCTLLDKPSRRNPEAAWVKVDYTGFTIPDRFVVGFGLDYDQRFRNLPYIGYVEDVQ